MKAIDFLEKLKESEIPAANVLRALFTHKRFEDENNRKKYPDAFDSKGNTTLKFNPNQKVYHTFCPYHPDQENGDSFAVYNNDQSFYCYSGCTPKPINIVDFTKSILFDLPPEVATNYELSSEYFWKAVRFLVENFGKELGVELKDLKSEGGFKRDTTQEILKTTVEYYHFLGTKTNYAKKLDEYYLNTRAFQYAEIPFSKIKEENKIGITPRSDEGDKLYQYLKKKNFTDEQIFEANVCFKTDDGKILDSFRNHAIVPYFYNKKVLGFYGKNLDPSHKVPHKRLAGIYDTPSGLNDISSYEEFFLVEGENTKLALKSMNFNNSMEMRGAKGFKDIHAEKIKKHREENSGKMKKCYLVLDPDKAGQDKVMETGKQLLEIAGVEPLVIRMPILEKDGEPWYLDVNDLYKAYGVKAKEVFLSLKEKAISLDAFSLIYSLKQESISTLSEARVALKRHSTYVESVPQMERIFIIEEVIDLLYPAFESVGLSKTELRTYLKEVWLRQEVKEPVEGLEEAQKLRHTYFILTQDESKYRTFKEKAPNLIFVRDITRLDECILGRNILFDTTFKTDQMKKFKSITNVYSTELAEDKGKVVLEYINKI